MATIIISEDKDRLNLSMIHRYISNSYWAKGRSFEAVKTSLQHSHCFGVFLNNEQIGLARVITDYITFAYLLDVFILDKHHGKGYGKQLMNAVFETESLQHIQKWFLITKDAQPLYTQFGFTEYITSDRTVMSATLKNLQHAKI